MARSKLCFGTWKDIEVELLELYMSVFKWTNLPPNVSERYLEESLMMANQAVFYYQEDIQDYICLKSSMIGASDIYGDPVRVLATGKNGFTEYVDVPDKGVVIFDNKTKVVPLKRIRTFSKRMASMELTIDVNISQQKTPRIWKANQDNLFSIKNFISQIENFEEYVIQANGMEDAEGKTEMVLAPAPFIADKVRIEKQKVMSEALTFFGIESNASEKKERLIADEVKASGGQADSKLNARFRQRQIAADKINEMYGLDIKVELNDEIGGVVSQMFNMEGGGSNE